MIGIRLSTLLLPTYFPGKTGIQSYYPYIYENYTWKTWKNTSVQSSESEESQSDASWSCS